MRFAKKPLATFVALLTLLAAADVSAYVSLKRNGREIRWNPPTVSYTIDAAGSDDVPAAQLEAAIHAAFASWEDVACTNLAFTFGGRPTRDPENGVHLRFVERNWDPSYGDAAAVAWSVTSFWDGGRITNAVIEFNGQRLTWTTSASEANLGYKADVEGIAAHEIGHTFGLDHTRDITATMFFSSSGDATMRTLESDDQRGVCYLYPRTAFADGRPCDSCTTDDHCLGTGDCLNYGAPNYFCGSACTTNSDCPSGFFCYTDDDIDQCVPNSVHCDDQGGNVPFGEYCWGTEVCESGLLCLPVRGDAYCTRTCTTSCPSGYFCTAGYCLRPGNGALGESCSDNWDCQSMLCATVRPGDMVCSKECTADRDCPGAARCTRGRCYLPGATALFESCGGHTDCQSAYCDGPSGGRFCTLQCTSGGAAVCPTDSVCTGFGYCGQPNTTPPPSDCTVDDDCPVDHICYRTPNTSDRECLYYCDPVANRGCPSTEVCVWRALLTRGGVYGECLPRAPGLGVGSECHPSTAPCLLHLLCVGHQGEARRCYPNCRTDTGQGCSPMETCHPARLTDFPLLGYCVRNPLPPTPDVVDPPADVSLQHDVPAPGPDTAVAVDVAAGPDTGAPPTPGPDSAAPPTPGPDVPATAGDVAPPPDGGVGGEGGGGGGGCHASAAPRHGAVGPFGWLGLGLFIALAATRRRERVCDRGRGVAAR